MKGALSYKLVTTAKVTTRIDEIYFPLYSPLNDAIRFEALSANGVVIAHDTVSYKVPRLLRIENVTVSFKDLAESEISSIQKVIVGWSYQ